MSWELGKNLNSEGTYSELHFTHLSLVAACRAAGPWTNIAAVPTALMILDRDMEEKRWPPEIMGGSDIATLQL